MRNPFRHKHDFKPTFGFGYKIGANGNYDHYTMERCACGAERKVPATCIILPNGDIR